MQLKTLDLKSFFFIAILLILGYVMLQLFSPFFNVIIVGLVIVQLFYPVYRRILAKVKNPGVASALTTVISILVVIVPIIVISLLVISEIGIATTTSDLFNKISSLNSVLTSTIDSLNNILGQIGVTTKLAYPDLNLAFFSLLESLRSSLLPLTSSIIGFSVSALFNGFLLLITLLYTFIEYEHLPQVLSKLSPLDDQLDKLLFKKFTDTTKAVIKGSFLVAIAQATAVLVALLILGVESPALFWIIMVILSLIPVGSGLVWFPLGIIFAINGQPIAGISLIIYSAVIINVIDTLLRPYLMKNAIRLHPLIIIFSALGGLAMFGALGILYGPLIAVFFTSLMDVYTERYGKGYESTVVTE